LHNLLELQTRANCANTMSPWQAQEDTTSKTSRLRYSQRNPPRIKKRNSKRLMPAYMPGQGAQATAWLVLAHVPGQGIQAAAANPAEW
jgi:hypothetical protein